MLSSPAILITGLTQADMKIFFRQFGVSVLLLMMLSQFVSAQQKLLPTIYHWDLRFTETWPNRAQAYDLRHVAACLQGLANREASRLFLIYTDADLIWLDRLTEAGGLCQGWSKEQITGVTDLFNTFGQYADGLVLYDADPSSGVISTSLAATTAAACMNGLAIRNDPSSGIYQLLAVSTSGPQYPILLDTSGKFTGSGTIWQTSIASTGSAKCDAYLWMKNKFIETGLADTTKVMYTLDLYGLNSGIRMDHWQLQNLDYAVSKKAVCFELSPWSREKPNDDPGQPEGTDYNTFCSLLDGCNIQNDFGEMIKFCGFTNWAYKYTTEAGGSNSPVDTEWQTVRLITAYNAYMEGDALDLSYVSNASFYSGLLPKIEERRYTNNCPPSYEDMVSRGYIDGSGNVVPNNYIMIYLGDYDQASWMLYWLGGDRFDDPARGDIPCNWALMPNAVDRVSVALDYMRRNQNNNDVFLAGDSGAGYVQPTQLYGDREPSGYSSGVDIWQKHCEKYYRMFDYSITGWILNAGSGQLSIGDADIYTDYSGDGIGFNDGISGAVLRDNVPVIRRHSPDLYDDNISADALGLSSGTGVNFSWYRSILLHPQKLKDLENECAALGNDYKFLDAQEFYYLLRYYLGGANVFRAAWLGDDVARINQTGDLVNVTVSVRNDAWDTWSRADGYKLCYAIVPRGQTVTEGDYRELAEGSLPAGVTISNNQTHDFQMPVQMPAVAGDYDLYFDVLKEGGGNNLLTNGSFEQDFTDWRYFAVNGATAQYAIVIDTYDGTKAARMTVTDAGGSQSDHAIDRDSHRISVEYGNEYNIRFASKKISGAYTRIHLTISEFDSAGNYIFEYEAAVFNPGTANYETFEYNYSIHAPQTKYINIGFRVTNALSVKTVGSYLVDAVEINGKQWFRNCGNLEWKKSVKVRDDIYSVDTDSDGVPDVLEQTHGLLYWHPDDGQCGDLGYLTGDISGANGLPDCIVDIYDLQAMAADWLNASGSEYGLLDFSVMAEQWLECNDPQNEDCW